MNDLSQDSLLREIDEDIRRERYAKLWKRFGGYVIAAAALFVAAVAGYTVWKNHQSAARDAASTEFFAAMAIEGKDRNAAEQAMQAIAEHGPAGYALLAAFQQAALLEKSDPQEARRAYQQLQQTAGSEIYRDLAIIFDAMVAMRSEASPIDADTVRAKLQPLTADSNPWRYSARELTALLDWRSGHAAEAKSALAALAADSQAPPDLRARARQLVAQIGEN
ncbi:MAG: tetratricopeptide repeat protein [Rhodospirillales bacterium]|nr:tetratricopeptide repeat protein [Rhodospirillales bacterium]